MGATLKPNSRVAPHTLPSLSESAGRSAPDLGNARRIVIGLLGLALFASGAAGLINQVVWQRTLRVFLGGSETVCSMIVVLVFMAGLGVGSMWMSRRVTRLGNPLWAFGRIELLLAVVNLGVCWVLSRDLTDSVYALQRLAQSLGVPLLALYSVLATIILLPPCLLMGATMPLAAEVCQRQWKLRESRVIGVLYGVNTFGSVLGTIVASGWMIARLGQTQSLLVAVTLNGLAASILISMALRIRAGRTETRTDADQDAAEDGRRGWAPGRFDVLAFGLGFCSLSFEMYLFRLIPLRHQPLPFTFAAVLTGFLLFWSVGACLAARANGLSLSAGLRLAALSAVMTVPMFVIDVAAPLEDMTSLALFIVVRSIYFLPCFFFGYLFSLVMQQAKSWGRDVGRLAAWNTLGCCLGTLGTTFIGYEIPFFVMVLAIALLLAALQEFADGKPGRWLFAFGLATVFVAGSFVVDVGKFMLRDRLYSGRDGVIFVTADQQLYWDGLWHSQLSKDGNHIGTKNWYLGVGPVLAHETGDIRDVCVIGVCTGITVGTLAKLDTVERIDGYDITHVLKQIYADYPAGTLHIATNPKVNLIWQDARTGLALNPQKYDLIQTQPLYLKQSGSGQLNSVEFFELVSQRLKPNGVFCLYSNGTPEQAFLVRETAAKVFPHRETMLNGYLVLCSNDPLDLSEEALQKRLGRADPLWREIRGFSATATPAAVLSLFDRPRLHPGDGQLINTDDFPIVEYPLELARRIRAKKYAFALPDPR